MNASPTIKLVALSLIVLKAGEAGWTPGMGVGTLLLLALLDAAHQERLGEEETGRLGDYEKRRLGEGEKRRQGEVVGMLRRLVSRRVAPFYLALGLLCGAGVKTMRQGDIETGRGGEGLAASRGWRKRDQATA